MQKFLPLTILALATLPLLSCGLVTLPVRIPLGIAAYVSNNGPIIVTGQLVDQDGQPLNDVLVDIEAIYEQYVPSKNETLPHRKKSKLLLDPDFRINIHGSYAASIHFHKEGYRGYELILQVKDTPEPSEGSMFPLRLDADIATRNYQTLDRAERYTVNQVITLYK